MENNKISEIEKLYELYKNGFVNQNEFEKLKQEILNIEKVTYKRENEIEFKESIVNEKSSLESKINNVSDDSAIKIKNNKIQRHLNSEKMYNSNKNNVYWFTGIILIVLVIISYFIIFDNKSWTNEDVSSFYKEISKELNDSILKLNLENSNYFLTKEESLILSKEIQDSVLKKGEKNYSNFQDFKKANVLYQYVNQYTESIVESNKNKYSRVEPETSNFNEFLRKFCINEDYCQNHIRFPLKDIGGTNIETEEIIITYYENLQEIKNNSIDLKRLINSDSKINLNENSAEVICYSSDDFMTYYFNFINGKWFLTEIKYM